MNRWPKLRKRGVTPRHMLALAVLAASVALVVTSAAALAAPGTINVLGYPIDRERVTIPPDWGAPLTSELRVQVAYNDEDIWFRAQFPAESPGIHHDYLVYQNGRWVAHGRSPLGSELLGLYEDRLTFHIDDGSVRGFANQGCAAACHSDMRYPFMYAAPTPEEVQANSYFRDIIGQTDTRKYIIESRRPSGEWWDVNWDDIDAEDAGKIQELKEAGVFLDQWHWRAARGGPLGVADNMHVLDYRHGDAGVSAFGTNWDADLELPRFMFDPERAGYASLPFEDVTARRIGMDQAYYLGPDTMTRFDPEYPWQEGDAVPRRFLREPQGSRGSISANAHWADGWWAVELRRKMDTGNPDDKALLPHRTYHVAFAFFVNATGNRFHYVTFPATLRLGQPAELQAVRFQGDQPPWEQAPVKIFQAYYPGQISWQFLTSRQHPGAPAVRADSVSCAACHSAEGLALRGAGLELRSERESPRPWTWAAGLVGILGIAAAGMLFRRE